MRSWLDGPVIKLVIQGIYTRRTRKDKKTTDKIVELDHSSWPIGSRTHRKSERQLLPGLQ